MNSNVLVFKDKDTHTEIRYVIAYYMKNMWYHYLDFSNIDDAKEHIDKARNKHPNRLYGLFEKIEQVTINNIDEKSI